MEDQGHRLVRIQRGEHVGQHVDEYRVEEPVDLHHVNHGRWGVHTILVVGVGEGVRCCDPDDSRGNE